MVERDNKFKEWRRTGDQLHHAQYKTLKNIVNYNLRNDKKSSDKKSWTVLHQRPRLAGSGRK